MCVCIWCVDVCVCMFVDKDEFRHVSCYIVLYVAVFKRGLLSPRRDSGCVLPCCCIFRKDNVLEPPDSCVDATTTGETTLATGPKMLPEPSVLRTVGDGGTGGRLKSSARAKIVAWDIMCGLQYPNDEFAMYSERGLGLIAYGMVDFCTSYRSTRPRTLRSSWFSRGSLNLLNCRSGATYFSGCAAIGDDGNDFTFFLEVFCPDSKFCLRF